MRPSCTSGYFARKHAMLVRVWPEETESLKWERSVKYFYDSLKTAMSRNLAKFGTWEMASKLSSET